MKEINAMGQACPRPVIMTKKAIAEENLNEVMTRVDNEIATENLSKMAEQLGFETEVKVISNSEYEVFLKKSDKKSDGKREAKKSDDEYIVVISSDKLGVGDEEFSKTLLEGFIYALTEQDTAPKYAVFYNLGVTLTTENEKTIEDLKKLEERGTEVLSCGLCLENYKVKDLLAVGSVTNMYRICELQIKYKTVKPC